MIVGDSIRSFILELPEPEIPYWRNRFGVSDDRLAEALHRVGLSAAAVEAHLNK